MDLTAIAALISALASALTAWVGYLEYQDKKKTEQSSLDPRSAVPTQSPPPQPKQARFLSSKKARRIVILGITALGYTFISFGWVLAPKPLALFLFLCGNVNILVGGIYVCVRIARAEKIDVWRSYISWIGMVLGLVFWLAGFSTEMQSQWDHWWIGNWWMENGLIIFLTSIYIGRW